MSMVDNNDEEVFDLNENLDEVEAAPDFLNPENGQHIFAIHKASLKDGKRVNLVYKLVRTEELADEDSPETPPGSLCSEGFTAKGKEFMKARFESLLGKETVKGASITDILAMLNGPFKEGYNFRAITKIKKTTKNGTDYENLQFSKIEPFEV